VIRKNIGRFLPVVLVALMLLSVISAFAANITVPVTHLMNQSSVVTANTLKPAQCSSININIIVYCPAGGGVCNGTNASELIIGSANIDTIQGKGGNDCILGGGGDDDIAGSQANDICIGGPGTDTFTKCETTIQ
jgi:hypothetical protein